MDSSPEDCFVVFVRTDRSHGDWPESAETPLIACPTYEEARRIQRSFHLPKHDCVIRYVGDTGGGD